MNTEIENGIYAAALTPLHPDLSINDKMLTEHCLQLMNRGCKGVVLFGTTGEGASFSTQEKLNTLKKTIAQGLNSSAIILGNGSACIEDTIQLALAALENQCLACLIAPPSFYKNISEEGVIDFYRAIIKRVSNPDLRVILYHIPQYSGVPLTLPIVKTLIAEFPGIIVGLKESEGNLAFTQAILNEVPECQVFVGKEEQIPAAVSYGAAGSICGMANLWPEIICSLYNNDQALPELKNLSSVFNLRPFIPRCKAILADEGNPDWRIVRPPLVQHYALSEK